MYSMYVFVRNSHWKCLTDKCLDMYILIIGLHKWHYYIIKHKKLKGQENNV